MFTKNAASGNFTLQNGGGEQTCLTEVKTMYALEKNIQLSVNRNIKLNCRGTE